MNTPPSELQILWQSSANTPAPELLEQHRQHLLQRLKQRYRTFWWVTGLASFWLGLLLVKLGFFLRAGGPMNWRQEWGSVLGLMLPMAVLALFWSQQWKHYRRHSNPGLHIRASLSASLDEIRLGRLRLRVIALMHLILIVLMPVIVLQLQAAGKAGKEILVPFLVILPALLGLILLALWRHDSRTLRPRERELKQLLDPAENPDSSAGTDGSSLA